MQVRGRTRRLVLAYVILVFAGVALIGAAIGSDPVMVSAAMFAYVFAMVHGVSFFVRVRRRRAPAALDPSGRRILAATLGAIAAVAIGNLVTVSLILKGHKEVPAAELAALSMWMVLTAVLCWRAWVVKSARRAGILQLIAVMFGAPSMINPAINAYGTKHHVGKWLVDRADARMMMTGMFIGFAVVACAGPVLDKLFSGVEDEDTNAVVPEAIVRG